MNTPGEGEVRISAELDIVTVRQEVRQASVALGFRPTDVTRIVTAASELARNVFLYAGTGTMRWRALSVDGNTGIELVFTDSGPGIGDVEQALVPGYTTGRGLGMGLPGAKRLMGEMDIQTALGSGTTVTVRKWQGRW
ncbi:MAG: anti-sigma regulatory factor [Candidatus Latescibacteria bacterium]|nr:anti-sigma regulatory factor [Candidatus Latescibacterota bacterium]